MKFGAVPLAKAEGALLAHSRLLPSGKLAKGTALTAKMLAEMQAEGDIEIIVARLERDDCTENEAAGAVAEALVPNPQTAGLKITEPFTGRVNLVADTTGIAEFDEEAIHRLNLVDPMLTLATIPQYTRIAPGMLVGTVKIISYAVPKSAVATAEKVAQNAVRVRLPELNRADLIITELSEKDARLRDKSTAAIEGRLSQLDMTLENVRVTGHSASEIASEIRKSTADLVLILTASATSDIDDVGPSAVRDAGGRVERFGMPVDPGNLLFLGSLGERPVIGLPGCARSPALNGADWVLERVVCGVPPTAEDIARMGVGGLLKEIPSRPQPRRGKRLA